MPVLINPYRFAPPGVGPITFVDSAGSSSSATITIPATAQGGDVAILFDINNTGGAGADVVPTGWTGIIGDFDGVVTWRLRISYKILAPGDEGDSITGLSSANSDKIMFVFRGGTSITAVSAEDWVSDITSDNPASQTVNASGQTVPLIVFGMSGVSINDPAFSTESPAFDDTVTQGDLLAGYKIYNSSPADHTIDMNDVSVNLLASGFLELS
jgi:hypothetical protein